MFGVRLAADFGFRAPLPPAPGRAADAAFTLETADRPGSPAGEPVYSSPVLCASGVPAAVLYREGESDLLRFPEAGDFYVTPRRILARAPAATDPDAIEAALLGPVLALWLERRGHVALHASAVSIRGAAIAFLANSGAGKSTLAAFLTGGETQFLTDDILAVRAGRGRVRVYPGYPEIRLWPDPGVLPRDWSGYARVRTGADKRRVPVAREEFCGRPRALRACYIPVRTESPAGEARVRIEAVSPASAVMELLRLSFAPRVVEPLGLQAARLRFLGGLVDQAAVRRLYYPQGQEHLPAVREAILADIASMPLR